MFATHGRESHRSPSASRLLSPERVPLHNDNEETKVVSNSTAQGVGVAAQEAGGGGGDSLARPFALGANVSSSSASSDRGSNLTGRGRSTLRSRRQGVQDINNDRSERLPPSTFLVPVAERKRSEWSRPTDEEHNDDDQPKVPSGKMILLPTDRIQQMHDVHRQIQDRLRTMREERATVGCTFSPRLASKQNKNWKFEGSPAYDRLYKESLRQRERREQMVQREESKLSFHPVLPTASRRLAKKATETFPSARHQRARARSRMTAADMYRDFTFTPNTHSTKAVTDMILAARGEKVPLVDRLYAPPEAQAAALKRREKARTAMEMGECTFRPNTNGRPSHSYRSSDGTGSEDPGTIYERLFSLHGKALIKADTKREASTDAECTFRPDLALARKSLDAVRGGNKRATEESETTGATRLEYMYAEAKIMQRARSLSPKNYTEQQRQRAEEAEMEMCTFKPDLSPTAGSRFKAGSRGKKFFDTLYSVQKQRSPTKETPRPDTTKGRALLLEQLSSQKTWAGRSSSPKEEKPVQQFAHTTDKGNPQATQCLAKSEPTSRTHGHAGIVSPVHCKSFRSSLNDAGHSGDYSFPVKPQPTGGKTPSPSAISKRAPPPATSMPNAPLSSSVVDTERDLPLPSSVAQTAADYDGSEIEVMSGCASGDPTLTFFPCVQGDIEGEEADGQEHSEEQYEEDEQEVSEAMFVREEKETAEYS